METILERIHRKHIQTRPKKNDNYEVWNESEETYWIYTVISNAVIGNKKVYILASTNIELKTNTPWAILIFDEKGVLIEDEDLKDSFCNDELGQPKYMGYKNDLIGE